MTSTLSRMNSAAISAKRSPRPSAQRYSIATVRFSIQPSSRSRCTKASVDALSNVALFAPRNPMVGNFVGCWARAASGHSRRRAAEQRDEFATFQLISLHSVPASQGRRQDIELAMVSQRVYDHTPARVRAR